MRSWLLRGLVFAILMVLVRLVQGAMIQIWPTQTLLISVFLVAVFAVLAFVWGLFDGRADAAAEPDPDRRSDLAMTWLLAGLVAGILSGAIAWFISLFYKKIYVEGIISELTTFAAFVALLTFVAAIIGVSLGRWTTDRAAERRGAPVGRHRTDTGEDTDVFAAVGGGREEATAAEGEPHAAGTAEQAPGATASGRAAEADEPRTEPQRVQGEGEGEPGESTR
jgi:hypothetical protein